MPSWACSQRSLSRLISWSRPVSGVSPAWSRRLDRVAVLADSLHQEQFDGLRHPLDLAVAEADAFEMAADQPVRGRAANDLAGLGDVLQPDRHVSRLPDQRDRVLAHLHDGRPGVDADPRIQLQLCVRDAAARREPSCPRGCRGRPVRRGVRHPRKPPGSRSTPAILARCTARPSRRIGALLCSQACWKSRSTSAWSSASRSSR